MSSPGSCHGSAGAALAQQALGKVEPRTRKKSSAWRLARSNEERQIAVVCQYASDAPRRQSANDLPACDHIRPEKAPSIVLSSTGFFRSPQRRAHGLVLQWFDVTVCLALFAAARYERAEGASISSRLHALGHHGLPCARRQRFVEARSVRKPGLPHDVDRLPGRAAVPTQPQNKTKSVKPGKV